MSFTSEQVKELEAPLNAKHVKSRTQAGRNLSYVEGWHAIAEANRIFGFDAWDRETVELRELGEPRQIDGKYRVSYMARVRIRVRPPIDGAEYIVRDGCGYGSGIDRDLGQAHESAIKEAETDAMKRALMTFGNPFGLALYDKEQANVTDERPAQKAKPAKTETPFDDEPTNEQREGYITMARSAIAGANDAKWLELWWDDEAERRVINGLTEVDEKALKTNAVARLKFLRSTQKETA